MPRKTSATHYTLHIRLDDTAAPVVWREIVVHASIKLEKLAWWIKGAFNWVEGKYHVHEWEVVPAKKQTAADRRKAAPKELKELQVLKAAYGAAGYMAHVPWQLSVVAPSGYDVKPKLKIMDREGFLDNEYPAGKERREDKTSIGYLVERSGLNEGDHVLKFTYDLGDCWEHHIHIKSTHSAPPYTDSAPYPRIIAGGGHFMPEDGRSIGSWAGFMAACLAAGTPADSKAHRDARAWYMRRTTGCANTDFCLPRTLKDICDFGPGQVQNDWTKSHDEYVKEYEGHPDEQDTEAGETDDDDNELDSGDGGSKVMPGWEGFAGMGGSAQQMRDMMRESQNRFRSQGLGVGKGKGKGKGQGGNGGMGGNIGVGTDRAMHGGTGGKWQAPF